MPGPGPVVQARNMPVPRSAVASGQSRIDSAGGISLAGQVGTCPSAGGSFVEGVKA